MSTPGESEMGELGESFVISMEELGVNGLWASVKQARPRFDTLAERSDR